MNYLTPLYFLHKSSETETLSHAHTNRPSHYAQIAQKHFIKCSITVGLMEHQYILCMELLRQTLSHAYRKRPSHDSQIAQKHFQKCSITPGVMEHQYILCIKLLRQRHSATHIQTGHL